MKAAAASTASCIAIRGVHGPPEARRPSSMAAGGGGSFHQRRVRAAPLARAGPTALLNHAHALKALFARERSGADESRDGGGGFGELLVGIGTALGDRTADAVPEVLVEQVERHRPQRVVGGADLSENVDAVFVVVDHLGDAAHLPLDAPQSFRVVVLLRRVSACGCHLLSSILARSLRAVVTTSMLRPLSISG